MGKFFSIDSPFYRFATRVADIMILNLLWIVCSIPLVTIGASTTAVYYVCLKMVKDEETYIVKSFFKSFKENFKQGTILWLLFVGISGILGANYYYLFKVSEAENMVLKGLTILVTIIYAFSFLYAFPLLARYESPVHKTIINSIMISIRYLNRTVMIVLILAALVGLGFYSKETLIFVLLLGVGVLCYVITCFVLKIFEDLEKLRKAWEENNLNAQEEMVEDNNQIGLENID
jgi:uncharacterized membrane protein YesL